MTYFNFIKETSVSGSFNPSELLEIDIPYKTLSTNQDANFFIGIKALV